MPAPDSVPAPSVNPAENPPADPPVEVEPMPVLDGAALMRWAYTSVAYLAERQDELNALNVFPIPDGDTGTNLLHTLSAALEAASSDEKWADLTPYERLRRVSRDAMMVARGNSGMILSQLLVGFTESVGEGGASTDGVDTGVLARAMDAAESRARAGVQNPQDGTILSVARAAADAARTIAARSGSLAEATHAVTDAARDALACTTDQLEALSRAGVVDAGGAGLVAVLEALDDVVHRRSRDRGQGMARSDARGPLDGESARPRIETCGAGASDTRFEVVYRLRDVPRDGVDPFTERLESLGDSVVVNGAGARGGVQELVAVHVHTADVGAAIEAAHPLGTPHGIRVELLSAVAGARAHQRRETAAATAAGGLAGHGALDAHGGEPARGASGTGAGRAQLQPGLAVVAAVQGEGLARLFREGGAAVVTPVGDRHVWDQARLVADLLAAVRAAGVTHVVVFPGGGDTVIAAQSVAVRAAGSGIEVILAGVHSPLQGLAAVSVWDQEAEPAAEAARLVEVADSVRSGAVLVAERAATYAAGRVERGGLLAYSGDDVRAVGEDPVEVCRSLVEFCCDRLGATPELVTLVAGRGHLALAERMAAVIEEDRADVEVLTIDGGDTGRVLRVGVE